MNQTARQSKVLLCIFIAIFVLEIPGGGGGGGEGGYPFQTSGFRKGIGFH